MASTAGQKVATLRETKGWSQQELADRVGVTVSTIWRWEKKRFNPDREQLEHVADVMDVRAGYLSDVDVPEFAEMPAREVASRESLRLFREGLAPEVRRRTSRYERAVKLPVAPTTRED